MSSNPINLALRFILETASLVIMGIWGWKQSDEWIRFVLAIGLPFFAAVVWGIFAVANDSSRSGSAPVPVPGIIRLAIEFFFFAFASWALFNIGLSKPSILFGVIVIVHYIVSYDRINWLLKK